MTELALKIDEDIKEQILEMATKAGLTPSQLLKSLIQKFTAKTNEEQENKTRKARSLRKYYGAVNIKEDPLELQKEWRNEWED